MVESDTPDMPDTPDTPQTPDGPRTGEPPSSDDSKAESGLNWSVHWLADYVYGTISTLVALAGLTFETNPGALTTAGAVVVGAVAIWLAHALSRLITSGSWHNMTLKRSDIRRNSWVRGRSWLLPFRPPSSSRWRGSTFGRCGPPS